jgi:hypothetical protein
MDMRIIRNLPGSVPMMPRLAGRLKSAATIVVVSGFRRPSWSA